jgi:hypothetical protein
MKSKALSRIGALVATGLFIVAGPAHAERASIKGVPVFVDPPPNAPVPAGHLEAYPSLETKVGADPGLRLADFTVKFDKEGDHPITIGATKMVPFKDSAEQMFIVILVQGTQRFMGASSDPEEQKVGYYEPVKAAIEAIAKARVKNTQVALWVYHAKVDEKVDFGPADTLNVEAIGALHDFADKATKGLDNGIQYAIKKLSDKPGRRVLVVIGEGEDQKDTWKPTRDVTRALENASIEVYVLGAGPGVQDNRNQQNLNALGALGSVKIANQREQVPQLAEALANDLNNVYTVTFPGFQESDGQRMPWDGGDHDFVVGVKKDDTPPKTLTFKKVLLPCPPGGPFGDCLCADTKKAPDPKSGCRSGGIGALVWILIAVGALLLIVVVVLLLKRRGGEEEIIEEAPQPVAAAPPPPAPAGPQKTQALFVGDDNAQPVVGWIVPTGGPSAWQTFKLSSRTVIGTAPDAQVNVGDAYMSANHAEILQNANGFILMDRGSQNGVIVNQKRVTQHELVDNDVFTCGRTEFKFKSIT